MRRTKEEITRKIEELKDKIKKQEIHVNLGAKEETELIYFIGPLDNYGDDREEILKMQQNFDKWIIDYEEKKIKEMKNIIQGLRR